MSAEPLAADSGPSESGNGAARPTVPETPAGPQVATVPALRTDGVALFTVDVEDYYHVAAFDKVVRREDWQWYPSRVEANVGRILDLLDEFQVRGTFFVLGWEAEKRPQMIRRIADRGHEVACHSHLHRRVFTLTPEEFRADTARAKRVIEDACGQPVVGYRAPSFSITSASLWAIEVLAELGFRYDSSIFPVAHPNYGIPGAPHQPHLLRAGSGDVWELPPASASAFRRRWAVAGGAYLRHLPFPVIKSGLCRLANDERLPAVLYLHPWEVDPGQPLLRAPWLTRVRHYRNLHRTEGRLRNLLGLFNYTTCGNLVDSLEGDTKPLVAPVRKERRQRVTQFGEAR